LPPLLLLALACTRPAAPAAPAAARPEGRRIVTLAPSLTDVVLALGARDSLVGVTRFDDAPEVQTLTRVGGYTDPSLETIVRLHPDLVVCQPSPGNKGVVTTLQEAGIPVEVFTLETIADVTAALTRLGTLLHREEAARMEVARIDAARARAREAATRRPRRPTAVLLFDIDPLIAAGPGSFAAELLEDVGARNVVAAAPQPYPQLPLETLLARTPDLVLVAPMAAHGAGLGGLASPLRPVARELASSGIVRPGPAVVDALEELTRVLDDVARSPP
jgi:iron complex transport system substrate-binding protein